MTNTKKKTDIIDCIFFGNCQLVNVAAFMSTVLKVRFYNFEFVQNVLRITTNFELNNGDVETTNNSFLLS